jgi:hypothetical protein
MKTGNSRRGQISNNMITKTRHILYEERYGKIASCEGKQADKIFTDSGQRSSL